MGCVKGLDLIHNFNAQPRSDLIMAKPSLYTFLFKKDIDALCQAYKTVHAGETIPVDKALLRKEVMFKESAFLYLKPDSLIHVPCHNIQYIRQLLFFKIPDILCTLCNISQDQAAQRISAAAVKQAVIAACDHIAFTQFTLKHLMICEAGLCTVQCAPDGLQGKVIFCNAFLIFHGNVGNRMFKLRFHF